MKKYTFSTQEYLSFGYIYLIVLGIISDVIFYKFIGLDILNYSSILDVMMSPINIITQDLKTVLLIVIVIPIGYYIITVLSPKLEEKYFKKNNTSNKKELIKPFEINSLIIIPFLLFFMIIGYGIGKGGKYNKRIEKSDYKLSHKVYFKDGDIQDIYIINQNSQYIFYVNKGDKNVSVSPIANNIKKVVEIN